MPLCWRLYRKSAARFVEVQRLLCQLAIPFQVNTRLVRGLDYYGHTAFEITSDQLGAQATVCGGGCHDGLVEQLGGSPTPAIGWALGMERLLLVLGAAAKADPDGAAARLTPSAPTVYLVNRGEAAEAAALGLARNLSRPVLLWSSMAQERLWETVQTRRPLRCSWALVIGDQEAEKACVRLKSLRAEADEQTLALDAIPALLEALG